MTITIVISSYKYGHLAAHCIESVIGQTRKPDKILFVDDGVGDCTHLPGIYPEVEYTFRQENLGVVANFQDMLEKVDTEYVMFLGADNWLHPETLETLEESKADIVTYDIFVTGELKDDIYRRVPGQLDRYEGGYWWDRSSGHHGSMLYRTKLGQQAKYRSPTGTKHFTEEDRHIYTEMLDLGATREHIPKPLLNYRRHRENFNPCK